MRVFLLVIACAVALAAQTPTGMLNQELYRRIKYSNDHFSTSGTIGWKTDRGQMHIKYGAPDRIEPTSTAQGPMERWRYREIALGKNVIADFIDANENGEYQLTAK